MRRERCTDDARRVADVLRRVVTDSAPGRLRGECGGDVVGHRPLPPPAAPPAVERSESEGAARDGAGAVPPSGSPEHEASSGASSRAQPTAATTVRFGDSICSTVARGP